MPNYQLVLASTSPYRKQLLNKLSLSFVTCSPDFDETPLEDETPLQLVKRLAKGKAESCNTESASLVIGSDQVCVIDGRIVGKPLSRENAIKQLMQQSGQSIQFYTGLALHNTVSGETDVKVDTFTVYFRRLTEEQVTRYVDIEKPYYCAGSFKSEGLGIALFDKLEGKDPNTLVGLPLIDLVDMLQQQGINVL